MTDLYEHPRAALSVGCVVFGFDERSLKVLLVQSGLEPHLGTWALPVGPVGAEESLEEAARRELERAGLMKVYLEQLHTFAESDHDPRERLVTVAYYALAKPGSQRVRGVAADARQAAWFATSDLPRLALDHGPVVELARQRLRGKVCYEPVGFELLPPMFTLTQLQHLYETILEVRLDKRNFRKKMLSLNLLFETGQVEHAVAHRKARLYRFDESKYKQLKKRGFNFAV